MSSQVFGYETHQGDKGHKSELSDSNEILFRRFSLDGEDELQMGELLFNNAFLGRPFDVVCPCKQWFSDVVLAPYIKYQRENIHIAVHKSSGRLIGYLTGSTGGGRFEKLQYRMVRREIVFLAASLTMPWTFFNRSSRLFATHVIFKGESERPLHPRSGVHWHFQVHKDFQGRGIGTKLLQCFVDDAITAGFDLIWAEVSSYPERPPDYFKDRGWLIYDAKPTEIFSSHVDFPVETLCITNPISVFKMSARAA